MNTTQTYVIVGGTKGIGLEIVKALNSVDHKIINISRSETVDHRLKGVEYHCLDIEKEDIPAQIIPDTLHGLIYCPGTITLKSFTRLKDEDFLRDFQVNVLGAVRVVRACYPSLKRSQARGSIVLFSSVAAQLGMLYHSSIASAKGAVESLTRSLAAEFAPGIRVNAISLSLTDTSLAQPLLNSEIKRKLAAERHPLRSIGSPVKIAKLAIFLLSDDADWLTGQIIQVDGGLSSMNLFK